MTGMVRDDWDDRGLLWITRVTRVTRNDRNDQG